jgi:hypothetical protein
VVCRRILPVTEAISERWGILEGDWQLKGTTKGGKSIRAVASQPVSVATSPEGLKTTVTASLLQCNQKR